jgi:dihydrofolate reductase
MNTPQSAPPLVPQLTIVVALDAERGIGINNTLPWRLKEDMAHFKRTTTGHPIIMGRKTFDSIGKPLPNRRNIVVTRNPAWTHEGVEAVTSIDAAIALLDGVPACVIGGAQIYAEVLPRTDRLIVTEIDKVFHCDTFFPEIAPKEWRQTAREQYHSAEHGFDYAFVTYQRI